MTDAPAIAEGERISVTGIVQGVGFRPFVYRLATDLGLDGHVGNDSTRVFIEAYGPATARDRFVDRLRAEAPPLALIDRIDRAPLDPQTPPNGFSIVESRVVGGARTFVSPDTALCADCRRELFDPADRRCGHPFITCTNCGPRFTIIRAVPYDRPNTTMAGFAMCEACRKEFDDPGDRRYHAQPIGCHDCGPTLRLMPSTVTQSETPLADAANMLQTGAVVAIKGIGGYHLACDATNDHAVDALRSRKHRTDKPFAVMVAGIEQARELADISEAEARLLLSPAAPIVLVRARGDTALSELVAPGNPLIGLILPYTPVHHLLFAVHGSPLVMTSANRHGEPIAYHAEMLAQADDLFDAVLDHDRPIHVPCDDSVVRVVAHRLLPIRRARGYAPIPVALPSTDTAILAVGGELKNTFCVAVDGHAWISQHIGDMENFATIQAFEHTIELFESMYDVAPNVVAADAHPGYLSSKWAHTRHGDRVVDVQHHHAHLAAVMAEHQIPPDEAVFGFVFDGTGYGHDGSIWGGEVLLADAHDAQRIAHLEPIQLPGGDAAVRNPCRVALAHLHSAAIEWRSDLAPVQQLSPNEIDLLRRQLDHGVACVPTTSMGRLFDAIASLLDYRHEISYEAQAAIELEIAAVRAGAQDVSYRFSIDDDIVSSRPVLRALVDDLADGESPGVLAWRFHDAVAESIERLSRRTRVDTGIDTVALSGGVFQNALLVELCLQRLEPAGFNVLTHSLVPPNDGGLALGQAYIAAHQTRHHVQEI